MDYYPGNDNPEETQPMEAYDQPDLENRLDQAQEPQPETAQAVQEAAQPAPEQAQPVEPPPAPETTKAPEPPPGHIPARSDGEAIANKVEPGPEKPEQKIFYPSSPEGRY